VKGLDGALAYLERGQGVPALLVHGNFASKRWWTDVLEAPPAGLHLFAPDLPGFGDSAVSGRARPAVRRYARSLGRFLNARGLKRAVLVGHSLGGAVVTEFAIANPRRVLGLLLLNSAPPSGLAVTPRAYLELGGYQGNPEKMAQALAKTMPTRRPPYFEALVADALRMHPDLFRGNARALATWSALGRSWLIRKPVLVVHGTRDKVVRPALARAGTLAFPKGRYLELEGLGHSPQIEDPARFKVILEEFAHNLV